LCGSRRLRRQRPPNHPPNIPQRRGQHKALKTKELSSMTAHEPNRFEELVTAGSDPTRRPMRRVRDRLRRSLPAVRK
jgi:hypothetical protein